MVRWVRTSQIVPANFLQAVQWAKEVAEYAKKYKAQVSVYIDSFGEFGTIRWFCDFADLAEAEKVGKQLQSDQEYLVKFRKGAEYLIPRSTFDTVMRSI